MKSQQHTLCIHPNRREKMGRRAAQKESVGERLRTGGGDRRGTEKVTTMKFFKIIIDENVLKNCMRLPDKFVSRHGLELGQKARLQVGNDEKWFINIKAEKRALYLTTNWKEFLENYSILLHYFLVFKYKGNSEFKVTIFDLSATEVEHRPRHPPNNGGSNRHNPKHLPSNSGGNNEIEKAMNRAMDYKGSVSTPCFALTIKKSHLARSGGLNIPREFTRKYLKGDTSHIQIQSALDDTIWNCRCSFPDAFDDSQLRVRWYDYALEVALAMGDACVLELLDANVPLFKVTPFSRFPN